MGSNKLVTWLGATTAVLGFLATQDVLGKYRIYAGVAAGVSTALWAYFAKGKDVTGGTLKQ
jgi:hypothetical protein